MKTKIQWCDYTWNPWRGCAKVSPGCAHCYAEAWDRRFAVSGHAMHWGPGKPRARASAAYMRQPLQWDRLSAPRIRAWETAKQTYSVGGEQLTARGFIKPVRPRVFCGSLMDWLDPEVPVEWLAGLLDTIRQTPNLDWLLLSKRPEKWAGRMAKVCEHWYDRDCVENWSPWLNQWGEGNPPPNVWLGTSAEDQQRWDERVPLLLSIPARIRFVSVEPMLGPIDFAAQAVSSPPTDMIDWIIFGGESGPNARPCNIEWIRSGVRQCQEAGVAPFVKQLGAHSIDRIAPYGHEVRQHWTDKKGGEWNEWHEDLRVREWPKEVEE